MFLLILRKKKKFVYIKVFSNGLLSNFDDSHH